MLFPSSHCQRSTDPSHISWKKGREEPATFPWVTSLRLVSETFPWVLEIRAREPEVGVTCGDVIETIGDNFGKYTNQHEYSVLPASKKRALAVSYRHNRSRAHGVPGGRLGEGLRRLDWLCSERMFGGIDRNDRLVKRLCGDMLPYTFELKCMNRYPMTAEEIRDHEVGEQRVESVINEDNDDE
jgi:hypothetical protein